MKNLPKSRAFHLLRNHPEFVAYYETTRIQQKQNFLSYFKQLNPMTDDAPIHLFDVGWKGTMQDNLAKLFPKRTILGFYIGLLGPGSSSTNPYKTGLLFDYRHINKTYRTFEENLALFEILLNAEHGSVIRYTPHENFVELEPDANEQRMFKCYIQPMQEKILQNFNQILPLFDKHELSIKSIASYSIQQHRRAIYSPHKQELQWFQQIEHFENFGLFTYTKVAAYWVSSRLSEKKLGWLLPFYRFYKLRIVHW